MERNRRNISRKEFAAIALGIAGISGYAVLNGNKGRVFLNYKRMGHCAPSVMQALLDINKIQDREPVRFSAAMAGGVGSAEMECGALTASLMFLGYQKGIPSDNIEKLLIIRQAQSCYNNFNLHNGSAICNRIRNMEDGCRNAVYGFHKVFREGIQNPVILNQEKEESFKLLLTAFADKEFHCAHNVFGNLNHNTCLNQGLYSASWPFLGGIALLNRTCGALAAGVMVLSSSKASIENSFRKVFVMNKMLKNNDPGAMSNEINAFNMAINAGAELGTWFRKEFGSTICRDIWAYDFSKKKDVSNYLSGNCLKHCTGITEKVADKVMSMIS